MESSSKESRIILAIQAMENNPRLTTRAAAKLYEVPRTTLQERRAGIPSRRDIPANSMKLTLTEETVLLEKILDLDTRGFQARLADVAAMANLLRTSRDASRVGARWAEHFVKRHPELTTRFRRRIDYQRAQCEDPAVVNAWFALVRNTIAKYGIQEADIYNFDETGFLMGMLSSAKVVGSSEHRGRPRTMQPGNREWVTVIQGICADGWALPPYFVVKGKHHLLPWYEDSRFGPDWRTHPSTNGWTTNEIGLDWIKHFEKATKQRTKGVYRLLVLDGHESHHSVDFEEYCKAQSIITLCMPPHSSHFLQPLDVACFSPLKAAYGKQIEHMMRQQITHISKEDFFDAFVPAFYASITSENIKAGFQATGLVPFNPECVISRLDPKPKTPSPQNSRPNTAGTWTPKTPSTAYEASRSSNTLKRKISAHQNSSPTHILEVVDLVAKGLSKLSHRLVLVEAENKELRTANERHSKRRRTKRTRLQEGGSLSLQEAEDILADREVGAQLKEETRRRGSRTDAGGPHVRHCSNCGKAGHNARTCQVVWETSDEGDLE
jgi:hypothetical protein